MNKELRIIIENYTHENSEVREHLGNGQYSTKTAKKEVTIFWEDGKFFNEVKHDDEVVSLEDVTEYYKIEALRASGEDQIAEKIKELNLEDVLSLQEAAEKWGMNDSTLRRAIAGDYKVKFAPHEYRKTGRNYIIKRSAMERVYGVIHEVTAENGIVYDVKLLGDEGIEIEYREKNDTEWTEATWSIFCENKGIELDALGE